MDFRPGAEHDCINNTLAVTNTALDDAFLEAVIERRKTKSRRHWFSECQSGGSGAKPHRSSAPAAAYWSVHSTSLASSGKSQRSKDSSHSKRAVSSVIQSIIPKSSNCRTGTFGHPSVRSRRPPVKRLTAKDIADGNVVPFETGNQKSSCALVPRPKASIPIPEPHPSKPIPGKVLFEDDYVSSLQSIIERDYYPDLPRLKATQMLLQAKEHKNPLMIQKARKQLEQCGATPGGTLPSALTSQTPLMSGAVTNIQLESPLSCSMFNTAGTKSTASLHCQFSIRSNSSDPTRLNTNSSERFVKLEDGREIDINSEISKYSVDQFQARFTSEDNASFETIIEKEKVERRHREAWIEATARKHNTALCALLESETRSMSVPQNSIEDHPGAAQNDLHLYDKTNDQPVAQLEDRNSASRNKRSHSLLTTAAEPRSALMFYPETSHLGLQPFEEKTKIINNRNTRFPTAAQEGDATVLEAQKQKQQRLRDRMQEDKVLSSMVMKGNFNIDESVSTEGPKPHGAVMALLEQTPNIIPGVGLDASPLVTWGEIASTPVLLPASHDSAASEQEQDFQDLLAMLPQLPKYDENSPQSSASFEIQLPGEKEVAADELSTRRSRTNLDRITSKRLCSQSVQERVFRGICTTRVNRCHDGLQ